MDEITQTQTISHIYKSYNTFDSTISLVTIQSLKCVYMGYGYIINRRPLNMSEKKNKQISGF